MNDRLRDLAQREGLTFEVAHAALQQLVVEAIDAEDRRKNQKAAEKENPDPVAQLDEHRRKRARRHRLICKTCGGRFTATRRHARFCSTACRVRACRKRSAERQTEARGQAVIAEALWGYFEWANP